MKVEQVDFITIPTRDIPRAMEWYRRLCGLPASAYNEGELEAPNVTLSFWNPEQENLEFQPNSAGVALRVDDVEAAVMEAKAAGAQVIGIHDSGVCHMGFVRDLDGNVLILHKRYAPKAPLAGADNQDVRALPARPSETTGRADRSEKTPQEVS
jgi:catechol 2,3-dioxygenase-like lactoylglutathione lyase family enzyme